MAAASLPLADSFLLLTCVASHGPGYPCSMQRSGLTLQPDQDPGKPTVMTEPLEIIGVSPFQIGLLEAYAYYLLACMQVCNAIIHTSSGHRA